MQAIETRYSVALRDYPEALPANLRIAAETRYAAELERQFGGPDQVVAALETMADLEASLPAAASPSDATLLRHWGRASVAARQAAMRDLGDAPSAYFDVERIPF